MSERDSHSATDPATSETLAASDTSARGGLPSWLLPAVIALIAALVGGAVGGFLAAPAGSGDPALSARVDALEEKNEALAARIDSGAEALSELKASIAQGAPTGESGADIDALTLRLNEVEKGLASLESRSGGESASPSAPQASGDLDAMTALANRVMAEMTVLKPQIEMLGREIAAVKEALPPDTLSSDLAALSERVAKLEAMDAEGLARRAASSLALLSVAQTAARGDAFSSELDTLAAVVPDDPAVQTLAPYAQSGVPDREALKVRFRALIPLVLHAESAADDRTWFDRLWTNALSLVTIRETGAQEGPTAEAILARAELKLAENDLKGAVDEMTTLSEAAKAPAQDWIEAAEARIALDRVLGDLTTRLIAHLSAEPTR
ncbi:MAG: hypothetical protein GC199_00825 [Alphaproteobacteria bacterium]|nr:hypothetical protein [Alphaproteobacteria bacterium]